jgi:hypothetical protein
MLDIQEYMGEGSDTGVMSLFVGRNCTSREVVGLY